MSHSRRFVTVVLAVAACVPSSSSLLAQETAQEYPAEIRSGACANAGDVVAPLANLVVPAENTEEPSGGVAVGQSYTVVPVPLANLLGAAHTLVVYASPQESTVPVACSDVGGALGPEGALALALNAVNGAKVEGMAYFAPSPAGDGTAVTLLLTGSGSGGERERVRPEREREPRADDAARAGEDGTAGSAGADGADGQPVQPGANGAPGGQGGAGATGTSRD